MVERDGERDEVRLVPQQPAVAAFSPLGAV